MKYQILENLGIDYHRFQFFDYTGYKGIKHNIDEERVRKEFE